MLNKSKSIIKAICTKTIEYKSVYLQDEIELTDSLNATIGARYDDISNANGKATFKAGLCKN